MQALLVSTVVVAIAEIGDRTQLLSLLLASRFKQPGQILCGIFLATIANHALAALAGQWIGEALGGAPLRWGLGMSFLAMAVWVLVPDKIDPQAFSRLPAGSAFLPTLCSFFIAEIGDKTQIATAALAARFDALDSVVIGTTVGMMIANIPAVFCGHLAGHRLDPRWTRAVASAILAAQAVLVLSGARLF
jgi:putative Ca2+/H+ antiporter (TMEM165/GDT1 family)